ncbi:hypothetical protein CVT24_007854 [Panaeolus cyanescens]|uniref:Serine/threonine-protein kinase Tel1 n=1 Tax=Panaeolus cyanescens TaxID=181874 RepID=A0A409VCH8_9AGAR|nr:hypothetical protein CVT24_007854 [Panaeolus cyanescens]
MDPVQDIINGLEGTTVSGRKIAIEALQRHFRDEKDLQYFFIEAKEPGKLLQALFTCILNERAAYVKKEPNKARSTARAEPQKRLVTAVQTLRWVAEKAGKFMARKPMNDFVEHLQQMLRRAGDARDAIILDYAKMLNGTISHRPHLEHLEHDTWARLVEISFNVILGDPISNRFGDTKPNKMNVVQSDNDPDEGSSAGTKRRRSDTLTSPAPAPLDIKPLTKGAQSHIVTPEQLEFADILGTLLSFEDAPIFEWTENRKGGMEKKFPHLHLGILNRLERILVQYPGDSSLAVSYLRMINGTLDHMELNAKDDVALFAKAVWPGLVGLWTGKRKELKPTLILILRRLFRFILLSDDTIGTNAVPPESTNHLLRLWSVLNHEYDSRKVSTLSIDSLRLVVDDPARVGIHDVFSGATFCAGPSLQPEEANHWIFLELQADCAASLFKLSESVHANEVDHKRARRANALPGVLASLESANLPNEKIHCLQMLLFFIDRHWHILHDKLKQRILTILNQCLSVDDNGLQSWVFINFAAISYAEKPYPRSTSSTSMEQAIDDIPLGPQTWDSIWAHAIRRMNVPGVCRSACHAANVILLTFSPSAISASTYLSWDRVLLDIESVIKDIDVQGPSYPHDSVCMFISRCLSISAQDVRLNQLRLEDNVLSWALDTWSTAHNGRHKLSTNQVSDVLALFSVICGFTKLFHPRNQPILPDCPAVDFIIEERKVKEVADFMLHARLSGLKPEVGRTANRSLRSQAARNDSSFGQSAPPNLRERKISAYFAKTLDKLAVQIEEASVSWTLTLARGYLDAAIAALLFESLLQFNGITSNKVVIQLASRLLPMILSRLTPEWNPSEKLFVLQALEVLIPYRDPCPEETFPDSLCQPDRGSGIRQKTLLSLQARSQRDDDHASQKKFYQQLWQHADLLEDVFSILEAQIESMLHKRSNSHKDDFGPAGNSSTDYCDRSTKHIFQICLRFRLRGRSLQPHRDFNQNSALIDTMLDCITGAKYQNSFEAPLNIFFEEVENDTLSLSASQLESFLCEVGKSFQFNYGVNRSSSFRKLVIKIMNAGLPVWINSQSSSSPVQSLRVKVKHICSYFAKATVEKVRLVSWRLKNALALFLERYLRHEPPSDEWLHPKYMQEDYEHLLPRSLLFLLNKDHDARTRFRVATINPKLFTLMHSSEITDVYDHIIRSFVLIETEAEHMITRLLLFGNIMVTTSSVRSGAYWHFLETYLHTPAYYPYMRSILSGVSRQLGMGELSVLFRAYGTHLACSLAQNGHDITQLPSQLLGYPTIQQCLESSLDLFTPVNVLKDAPVPLENTCSILGKSIDDVKDVYFGSIVGTQIANDIHEKEFQPTEAAKKLSISFPHVANFKAAFSERAASIVAAVLRSMGDQDVSEQGPILDTLSREDNEAARVFMCLVRFRKPDDVNLHTANFPAFDTKDILCSLQWVMEYAPETSAQSLSYHVLHMLMADIHQSPLVNEQFRLLNALCLWIACYSRHFEELALLHTLAHNTSLLLSQPDLARAAQSLLDWTFQRYISERLPEPRIRAIITRCCAAAHAYTTQPEFSDLGSSLFDWIEQQALKFLRHEGKTYRSVVLDALSAWPRPLTAQLGQAYEGVKVQTVCTYLGDARGTSNKFHLSRRLRDFAALGLYSTERFSGTDFWRLKDSIPREDEVQDDDITAFATLLYLNHGQINGLNLGEEAGYHPRHIHKYFHRIGEDKAHKEKLPKPGDKRRGYNAIINGLLAMLEDENPSRVFSAYQALCLCITVLNSKDFKIPSHCKTDLVHLINNKVKLLPPSTARLFEYVHSDLCQQSVDDFSTWICTLATILVDELAISDVFYGQLHRIVAADVSFSETVLPILVHILLDVGATNIKHSELLSEYFTAVLKDANTHPSCLQAIVDVVLHSRYFHPAQPANTKGNPLAHNLWLQLDFTLLAQSATRCGSYTTALLFLELDAEMKSSDPVSAKEHVLYEIYRHIDEPDGFYGIKTDDLQSFLLRRFHHEEQWDKALRFHSAALEAGDPSRSGLIQSFRSFGFDHMALDELRKADKQASNSSEASTRYKLGWRTETWDLPDPCNNETGAPLYLALRAVHRERDANTIDSILWSGMRSEVERLRCLGSENVAEIRAASQDLMCLNQILQFRQDIIHQKDVMSMKDTKLWSRMSEKQSGFGFADLEALVATRMSLIRSLRQKEELSQIGNLVTPAARALMEEEKACLLRLSRAARASGKHQIALNSVMRAQKLDHEPSAEVSEEFAHVLWEHKEEKTAVQFLQRLIRRHDESREIPASTKALWNAHLGSWTSDACLENPNQIWENYFSRSIDLLRALESDSVEVAQTRATVYRKCAMFAERQYQATLKSPDGLRWKVYVERKRQEVAARNEQLARSDHASKQLIARELDRATKLLATDSELFKKHHSDREIFLKHAIDMHSRCLELSDEYDTDSVVRFSSLWFANFEDQTTINWVTTALERISSRKFVFLAHQLTARMSDINQSTSSASQSALQHLVLRMCAEHPFHSLYQVYCLSDHTSGQPTSGRRQSGRSFTQGTSTQTDRMTAANNILDQLRAAPGVGQRIRDIERLCAACLEWAKYPIKNNKAFAHTRNELPSIPANVAIRSIENLKVPVSTARTPIDMTMQYKDCVWITRYDTVFRNAGGNSVPKIVTCVGSDGRKYKQLFKGEGSDDLRQDAVMEQVFDLVNNILRRDQETRRRSLQVRDYKVIPLDTQAGLLEFVEKTQQIGNILKGMHAKWVSGHNIRLVSLTERNFRYNPHDILPDEFYKDLKSLHTHKSPRQVKLAKFLENRKRFKPAMRHYFMELYKMPLDWFRRRLAYTRSVATTSIVGHVLGLGDRHVSNILIDNVSGEVVHIDLGIAFEQGKLLPVPECVPFRMTADMVDGMGTSGTAGVFQRCAEETLRVLREESGVILTVLEVFKHDPLHQWTVSEIKVHKAQDTATSIISPLNEATRFNFGIGIDMTSGSADEAADRALSSVARKLDKSLSVESTVNELIAEATDPMNLATIYCGWSPHL